MTQHFLHSTQIERKTQFDNERTGLPDPSTPQKIAQDGAYIAKTAVDSVSRIRIHCCAHHDRTLLLQWVYLPLCVPFCVLTIEVIMGIVTDVTAQVRGCVEFTHCS